MIAWARGVAINGLITGRVYWFAALVDWRAAGAHVRRVRISRRVFAKHRGVSRFHSDSAGRAEHGRDKILAL